MRVRYNFVFPRPHSSKTLCNVTYYNVHSDTANMVIITTEDVYIFLNSYMYMYMVHL